jgi:hypothetical protein
MIDDPKDDLPDFLDLKKTLPSEVYAAGLAKAREATERANRPARPSAAPKPQNEPTASLKPAPKASKLPVPPPKTKQSVVAKKKLQPAVERTPQTEDVQSIGKTPPAGSSSNPPEAAKRKDYPMTTTTKTAPTAKTAPKAKTTKRAPNGKAPRTAVKGKTSAKRVVGTPRDGTMTVEILKMAARKNGVSREELNELTEWTGAPWRWNFSNKYGTGYCDRFGYKLDVRKGKDGETRYFVTKR